MTPANNNGNLLAKYQNDVLAFHQALALSIGDPSAPSFIDDATADRRARLINEEIGETVHRGIMPGSEDFNIIEVVDGLVDSLYVTLGGAIDFGFDMAPLVHWNEPKVVHDPKALLSRKDYFAEMLIDVGRAACSAIDARSLEGSRATLVGLIYALNGAVNAWNIPILPFWNEVHRANMEKWPPEFPGGKARKPEGWRPPDHLPIFADVFRLSRAI